MSQHMQCLHMNLHRHLSQDWETGYLQVTHFSPPRYASPWVDSLLKSYSKATFIKCRADATGRSRLIPGLQAYLTISRPNQKMGVGPLHRLLLPTPPTPFATPMTRPPTCPRSTVLPALLCRVGLPALRRQGKNGGRGVHMGCTMGHHQIRWRRSRRK